MISWLFILLIPLGIYGQTTLSNQVDCGFLADSFEYNISDVSYNYTGDCCSESGVRDLDKKNAAWRSEKKERYGLYVNFLRRNDYCQAPTVPTTTVKPTTVTTTPKLDCFKLDPDCCSTESIAFLDKNHWFWQVLGFYSLYESDLRKNGLCGETTTMTSIQAPTTTITYNCNLIDEECCNAESIDFLDKNRPKWRDYSVFEGWRYSNILRCNGLCSNNEATTLACDSTTSTLIFSTVTTNKTLAMNLLFFLLLLIPPGKPLNCYWLSRKFTYNSNVFGWTDYKGTCCKTQAVNYLNGKYSEQWKSIIDNNGMGGLTETVTQLGLCGPETSTSTPPTTTTTPLECGALANTSCCTLAVTSCLTKTYGIGWTTYNSSVGFEKQLEECGCVMTTTSTVEPTTSSSFNCTWLSSPFNYTRFHYNGTCCSKTSVDTLNNNGLSWLLENPNAYSQWDSLVSLLYCTPGACTDPPLWTNCSISSTSSSSTTSPSTTSKGSTSTASIVSTSTAVSPSSSSVGTSAGASETPQTSETTVTSSETSQGTTEVETTSVTTSTSGPSDATTTGGVTTDSTPSSSTVAASPGSTPTSTTTPPTSSSTVTSTSSPATSHEVSTTPTPASSPSTVTSTSSPATSHEVSTTPTSFVSDLASTIASTLSTIFSSVTSTEPLTTLTTPLGSSTSGLTSTTSGQTAALSTQPTGATESSSTTAATTDPTTDTAHTGPIADADGVVFRNTTVNLLPNCTQITVETLFFANGTTLRNTTVEFNACSSTSPLTTAPTTPEATTMYNWPTGGTTRTLPSGEIIISESLIAYKNCTTVLMQLIYNPATNTSRTAITSDPEGCKITTATAPMTSTASPTAQTTTFNWPTGGTTRTLPSGDIILSESLIAYKNCTTVLMQLIFTPSTNQTRTETTTDAEGCKASSTTTPMPSTTASSTAKTTTYNWPTGGTTRVLPSGEIIISESLIAYQNCTTVLMQLIFTPSTNQTRTETTTDVYGCKSSSSSSSQTSSKLTTPMPSSTSDTPTTTFPWPTGGTTRTLPSGDYIISESLTAYKNCTTVLMQLIYNPKTNTTRTETTSDAQGCKATSSSSKAQTTPMPTTTPGKATTTFPWPTGGTTRTLPSGEIIISESLTAYKNCTTVLMQLIYNPKTNTTRTESTSDAEGCKTTPTTTRAPTTTTFNWPTGGTTRVLPSGEIIISESLTAYKNCTTVLMQLLYNPTTNTTRTETTSDAQGCKATSTKAATTTPSTTTRTPSTSTAPPTQTTTYNWPTGGTTRLLPSGEIILSESLIAYKNCTTVLLQLIYNPTTNTTRTETTKDEQGCKATSTTSRAQTTTPMPTTMPSTATTTFNWPTGGTTRTLPSGEIILSESLTAYPNCTTTLRQLILNPTTNTTRTETMSDAQGCKATSTSKASTTPMSSVPTTTESPFTFPESKTTQILPSGEIILSESLTAYPNCTTTLRQLILNPTTNTTRTETMSDAQGCKATSTTKTSTTPMSSLPTSTELPFTFPESKTTQILPSGEIILSESLTAYPNCTTTLRQLILNPVTNTTRTETVSDAQGCKATTTTKSSTKVTSVPETSTAPPHVTSTTAPTHCPALKLDMSNTVRPTFNEIKGSYAIGDRVVHMCKKRYAFEYAGQPLKIYQCMPTGKWAGEPEKCISSSRKSEL